MLSVLYGKSLWRTWRSTIVQNIIKLLVVQIGNKLRQRRVVGGSLVDECQGTLFKKQQKSTDNRNQRNWTNFYGKIE